MKLLLDTHILLWALANDQHLSDQARKLIADEKNDIYYSILSLWEIELKRLAHPDVMAITAKALTKYCAQAGFLKLSLQEQHIFAMETLKRKPDAAIHKDPVDRLLVCQAKTERMLFLTHDALISGYDEKCILAV